MPAQGQENCDHYKDFVPGEVRQPDNARAGARELRRYCKACQEVVHAWLTMPAQGQENCDNSPIDQLLTAE